MPRYIIKPRGATPGGTEGASGTVIYTETAAKARELGAAKLGRRPQDVSVTEHDSLVENIFGAGEALTEEEAAQAWQGGTEVVPGSWEGI